MAVIAVTSDRLTIARVFLDIKQKSLNGLLVFIMLLVLDEDL
jgi:hypothetical protein